MDTNADAIGWGQLSFAGTTNNGMAGTMATSNAGLTSSEQSGRASTGNWWQVTHGADGSAGAGPRSGGQYGGGRGFIAGGWYNSFKDYIEYITINTTGNATSFGSLSSSNSSGGGCSSPTRALFAGGNDPAVKIEYVSIATQGNGVVFGDLTYTANRHGCGTSNAHGGL